MFAIFNNSFHRGLYWVFILLEFSVFGVDKAAVFVIIFMKFINVSLIKSAFDGFGSTCWGIELNILSRNIAQLIS